MKQFGQGLHTKQLQGNEVSHSFTQSNCRLLPKEQSQPPRALCLHPLPWVSSSFIDRDELEQVTNPALNNPPSPLPSLQTLSSVRSVSTCGCNMLVGALEVAGCYLSAVQLGVGQMQSTPFVALSSSVRLNQLRKGVSFSLQRH